MCARHMLLLFVSLICSADCVQVPVEVNYGSIELTAFDILGGSLPSVQAELKDTRERVTYGDYNLRIWARGFDFAEQTVRVYQANVPARVQLSVGVECGTQHSSLIGSLTSAAGTVNGGLK